MSRIETSEEVIRFHRQFVGAAMTICAAHVGLFGDLAATGAETQPSLPDEGPSPDFEAARRLV